MRARRLEISWPVVALASARSRPLGARLLQPRGGAVVGAGDVVGALLERPHVAELAQGRQGVVELGGRDAQDERRAAVAVAGADLWELYEAAGRLGRADDAVSHALDVGRRQLEARRALDTASGGRGRVRLGRRSGFGAAARGGAVAGALAGAAGLTLSELLLRGGSVLARRTVEDVAVVARPARRDQDGDERGDQAARDAEGG
jgi:hypothetical protein